MVNVWSAKLFQSVRAVSRISSWHAKSVVGDDGYADAAYPRSSQESKSVLKIRKALDGTKPTKRSAIANAFLAKKDTPAVVLMLRADAYIRIGRYDDALRDARKAQLELGEDIELRSQFIGAFLGQGLADSALHYVAKGGEMKNDQEYHLSKGCHLWVVTRLEQGVAGLRQRCGTLPRFFPNVS